MKQYIYDHSKIQIFISSPSKSLLKMGFSYYSPLKPLKKFISSNLMTRPSPRRSNVEHDDNEFRPSPSLVLLPDYLTNKSIHKNRLPIVEYATLTSHNGKVEDDCWCAVCLSRVEAWHNVRELGNCEHAFHVECIDSWMDRGGETCPVCRAQLVSGEVGQGKDPWRSQRMVYLFGEDCFMEELQ
ncbi:probable E3 ubiquitin-protein ligase RHA1A [Salvia miltiorrhiza]|uniref:probable E3 ubiquitin-protein ligase RHA1A n=1 Tax=Salvia miltiorrhiza TaxID=226208 RepID=UPI0025AB82D6|nr:probable E3 ubiquitin-protein ligase RHA1A [Salvia miltiorrhiza]